MQSSLKQILHAACMAEIDARIADDLALMNAAQQAANDDDKSSAGDKYETGRAMMQREKAMYERRLAETIGFKRALEQIDVSREMASFGPGAAARTSMGNFFCALSCEDVIVEGELWVPISAASPVGMALMGCRSGETVVFRDQQIAIIAVI